MAEHSGSPSLGSRIMGMFQRWTSSRTLKVHDDTESAQVPSSIELDGCAMTATQITANKDGSALSPAQHGTNRDSIRMGIIARNCGIVAVADGCALSYWSEIAAHVAAHEFVAYMYQSISNGCSLFDLKRLMTAAVLHVNDKLQMLKHPKTKKPLSVLENGGNTTLLGAVIFPYIGSLDQFADGGTMASSIPADLQHKPSPDDDPFEEKWALICVGMGDCELHYFKLNRNEAGEIVEEEVLVGLEGQSPPVSPRSENSSETNATATSLADGGDSQLAPSSPRSASSDLIDSSSQSQTTPRQTDEDGSSSSHRKKSHRHGKRSKRATIDVPALKVVPEEPEDGLVSTTSVSDLTSSTSTRKYRTLPAPESKQQTETTIVVGESKQDSPRQNSDRRAERRSSKPKRKSPRGTEDGYATTDDRVSTSVSESTSLAHSPSEASIPRGRDRSASVSSLPNKGGSGPSPDSVAASPLSGRLSPRTAPTSPALPEEQLSPRKSRRSFRLSFVSPKKKSGEAGSDGASVESADATAQGPPSPAPQKSTKKKTTCGKWIKVLGDNGRTPFLPFPGLKQKTIPEPLLMHFRPGDLAMVCSDGVMAAFDKATNPQLPPISREMYLARDGVHQICQHLMTEIFKAHNHYHTDPDDVALGIFKLSSAPDARRASKPNEFAIVPPEDLTYQFLHTFAHSKGYKRDYLDEWLTDYPKK